MKPSALAVAALATLSLAPVCAPAFAADLATKYPIKALPTPVFSWTGFYIGGNVGYGGGDPSGDGFATSAGALAGYGVGSITSSGFIAGGQAGYNYQFANNVVVGLETDLQWSGIKGQAALTTLTGAGALSNVANASAGVDYYGTIRARLGYAIDRFLPYVTGGVAYGRPTFSGYAYDGAGVASFSSAATNWGWTLGAGGEFAVTNNWTVKAEYMYVDLGSMDYAFYDSVNATAYAGSVDSKFHTMKAGINYKF